MILKRIFDLCLSFLGLLLLTPLLLICGLLIKLDSPGPVLFTQNRVGKKQKLFKIYKFRTMRVEQGSDALRITSTADKRITDLGKQLRKYKIDELPQLFNVLKGDMSLVGPRPEVPEYVEYWPEEAKRLILSVPPGITDNASLEYLDEGRILAEAEEPEKKYIEEILPKKLEYYLRYVEQRSFLVDISLIFRTLVLIFRGKRP